MDLGLALKYYRTRPGHTWRQEDLAQALGVEVSAVSFWETNRRHPGTDHLKSLAAAFGVTTRELLDRAKRYPNPDRCKAA